MAFIPIPNEFQKNKLLFFERCHYSENTKISTWNLYLNYISQIEKESNKDMFSFTKVEIDKCNNNISSINKSTVGVINAFIKSYIEWYSKEYNKKKKPFKLISKKVIENSWYVSKTDVFDICKKVLEQYNYTNILPLLLIRCGITGKEMIFARTIRWRDINFDENKVTMYNENNEVLLQVPIDLDFIKLMELVKYSELEVCKNNIDNYLILRGITDSNEIINYSTINSRIYKACKIAKIKRISPFDLENSAKVDYLYGLTKQGYSITVEIINEMLIKEWYKKTIAIASLYNLKRIFDNWLFDDSINKNNESCISVDDIIITNQIKEPKRIIRKQYNNNLNKKATKLRKVAYEKYKMREDVINTIDKKDQDTFINIKGNNIKADIKIDNDSIDRIKSYIWYPNLNGEVVTKVETTNNWKVLHLANIVLNENERYVIKYANGDKWDCRKANLIFELKED